MKNLWSLNIDELLVAGKLKEVFGKKKEVFFPLNSQLKGIDLVLVDQKTGKVVSLQVKGSRTYTPNKAQASRWGEGSAAWFVISKKSIFDLKNEPDLYAFVLHSISSGKIKKEIEINYLVVPTDSFRGFCRLKKIRKGGKYHFFIWIDSKAKRAFDFNNKKGGELPLSKYLDNWTVIK